MDSESWYVMEKIYGPIYSDFSMVGKDITSVLRAQKMALNEEVDSIRDYAIEIRNFFHQMRQGKI